MTFPLNINNKMIRRPGFGRQYSLFTGSPTPQSLRRRRSDWEAEDDGGGSQLPRLRRGWGKARDCPGQARRWQKNYGFGALDYAGARRGIARGKRGDGKKITASGLWIKPGQGGRLARASRGMLRWRTKADFLFTGSPTPQSLRRRRSDWEAEDDGGRISVAPPKAERLGSQDDGVGVKARWWIMDNDKMTGFP